jgi:hypothetical protein
MAYNRLSLKERLLNKAVREGDCLVWRGHRSKRGYGRIRVAGKWRPAHVVSYEVHKGPIPAGLKVLHSCDNPPCIEPAHLSAGTQLDNVQDMLAKGRANKATGERHGSAKLTAAQVAEIRRRFVTYDRKHGTREPSRADEHLTQALKHALALVDVRVLDHFVIAGSQATSFAERGLL